MIAPTRILSVAEFALGGNLRKGLTRGGVILGFSIMLVGPTMAIVDDLTWSFDGQFGFFGFLVVALFGLRSGLQEQRELGLTVFLRRNVLSPVEHAVAMILSLIGSWAALCAVTFLGILAISVGDVGQAAWHTASWGLRALLLLGFVPVVERLASFRLPLFIPALAYMILLVALTILLSEAEVIALFVPVEPGDPIALRRLGLQALVVFPTASSLFLVATAVAPWLRRSFQRVATGRR